MTNPVIRDADECGEAYSRRAMARAAAILEERVKDWPEGYHKHWNLVDAELLRRASAKVPA